jgi:hypothetical protein
MDRLRVVPAHRIGRREEVTWELLPARAALDCPDTLRRWRELLGEYATGQYTYQTPEWFAHVDEHGAAGDRAVLALARADGVVRGLAPLSVSRDWLCFRVAGRTLFRSPLMKLSILGGHPLLPESHSLYDGLFHALDVGFPECDGVGLSGVTLGSFLRHYLWESSALRGAYLPHLVDGVRSAYSMALPALFSDYLASLRRKKRYNIGRETRLLREHGMGALELDRIDTPVAVPGFLGALATLAQSAGRRWADYCPGGDHNAAGRWLAGAARLGLLCSYLLRCRGVPVAALFGYQHGDTCLVECTLYSPAHARFSPGTVLLHLAIEDLIGRGVRCIDFGVGNPTYGNSSTLTVREEASVILWRKTLANRLRRTAHAGFRVSTRCLRWAAVGMGLWHRHSPRVGHYD